MFEFTRIWLFGCSNMGIFDELEIFWLLGVELRKRNFLQKGMKNITLGHVLDFYTYYFQHLVSVKLYRVLFPPSVHILRSPCLSLT